MEWRAKTKVRTARREEEAGGARNADRKGLQGRDDDAIARIRVPSTRILTDGSTEVMDGPKWTESYVDRKSVV